MKFEPVALTELMRQFILALVAFGLVHWNEQQTATLLMLVSALLAYIARGKVTPNATIEASDTTVHDVKAQARANASLQTLLLPLLLTVALASSSCATAGGPRHIATVTVVTEHSILAAVQDATRAAYCDAATAPPAPNCIDDALRRKIASALVTAFDLDAQIARTVRPIGQPTPAGIADLIGQVAALIDKIVSLIPQSPLRATLISQIGGR